MADQIVEQCSRSGSKLSPLSFAQRERDFIRCPACGKVIKVKSQKHPITGLLPKQPRISKHNRADA